jgi:hypothetical protein
LSLMQKILFRITNPLPCRIIDGDQGEPYLERYYLFGLLGWHVYIHRFVASDPDRGLHDHPWGRAISLVLSGGYREVRGTGADDAAITVRRLRGGRINLLKGDDFHRVLLEPGQDAWTLFAHGRRVKGWGFLHDGRFRPVALDGGDFRHRDWWINAPNGRHVRAARAAR